RFWDHDLGPRWSRLLRLCNLASEDRRPPEDLTGDAINSLEEAAISISPDGGTVVTTWRRELPRGFHETDLVAIEDGKRRTIASGTFDFAEPQISPDGRRVVAIAEDRGTPQRASRRLLWRGGLESGRGEIVAPDFEQWPAEPRWSADGSAVFFVADQKLRRPVFRFEVKSGKVTQVTREGAFTSICPDPSGEFVYALRTSWSAPLEAVRVGLDGEVTALPTPGFPYELPGVVSEVEVAATDGTPLHGWLVLPN